MGPELPHSQFPGTTVVKFFKLCIRSLTEYSSCPVYHDCLPEYLSNNLEKTLLDLYARYRGGPGGEGPNSAEESKWVVKSG